MEKIKGTDILIVDVLKAAKIVYSKNTLEGMCQAILTSLWKRKIFAMSESECIPLFNKSVAEDMFGAKTNCSYWWLISNTEIRIKYFDWLIEYYSK